MWKLLDLFSQFIFSCVVGANSAMEVFISISGFLGAYKCLTFDPKSSYLKSSLSLIGRKFIRIAPLFYLVFFFGWIAGPWLQSRDAPQWYLYQSLYQDCDRYWWSQLLFIGNWVPFFEDGNRGCFFWGFGIYCDLQLFLLVPPLVYLLKKNKIAGFIVLEALIAVNIAVNILVTWKYDLKAGPLAIENYYSFAYLMYKPYSKLAYLSIGI